VLLNSQFISNKLLYINIREKSRYFMGLEKIGISLAQKTATWVRTAGKNVYWK
jgi:hypothetical protein